MAVDPDNPAPISSNPRQFYLVKTMAFWVTESAADKHRGTLIEDDIATGPGVGDWCRDRGGVVMVRLTR